MISIKSIYVNSLECVRVKGGESECFRIDCSIMSPWLVNVYLDAVMQEVKLGMRRRGSEISGRGKRMESAWPLVSMQITWFCVVSQRKT